MRPLPQALPYATVAGAAVLLALWQPPHPPSLDATQARALAEPALAWLDEIDGDGPAARHWAPPQPATSLNDALVDHWRDARRAHRPASGQARP